MKICSRCKMTNEDGEQGPCFSLGGTTDEHSWVEQPTLPHESARWRVGTKLGLTIYRGEMLMAIIVGHNRSVGAEIAKAIVAKMNAPLSRGDVLCTAIMMERGMRWHCTAPRHVDQNHTWEES